ncbi:MAG: YCF48-related protein [Ignavibacteria bacterium]|jgi:photosystem II stability/assembly factor-like uncharacterized protein|nr:YCF48-related protein [Ignavibacteria bacterium]
MKNFKYLLIILLISANSLYSQPGWQLLNSGTTSYLTSVFFHDTLTGYIGGQNGYLAKTTNGGLNWTVLSPNMPTSFVRDMDFINTSTGYICGDNAVLRKTTNGGVNWTVLSPGASGTYYAVSAPNSQYVYVCTQNGAVLKSTDAGSTWNVYTASANSLLTMDFPSQDTGYTAGQGGVAYKTINGGVNWISLNVSTLNNFWGMHALDNNFAFFAANYGTIRSTTNGSYINSHYAQGVNLEKIFMTSKMIGYACGSNGQVIKTIDGGRIWSFTTPVTTEGLTDIFFLNHKTGYAVGANGTVIKTNTGGGDNHQLKLISPNGGEIWYGYATRNIIWSSSIPGNIKLEYTFNNGSTWQTIIASFPASEGIYSWSVPSYWSAGYKIRISSLDNPAIFDISDNYFSVIPSGLYAYFFVPEILYCKFNNVINNSTPNYALPGDGAYSGSVTGHTYSQSAFADSALTGGGGTGADHCFHTGWAANLPDTAWTIGFWVSNINLGTVATNPVYLFGDVTASNFRCYYGGSGGLGTSDTAIMLRATGMSDVRIPVVRGVNYFIHIVYSASAGSIKTYRNGALYQTIPQTPFRILGNGPFYIGSHSTFASSLAQDMKLDEFRLYNRALSLTEVSASRFYPLPFFLTGIKPIGTAVPGKFELSQNYPNPFNPSTKIRFSIPSSDKIPSPEGYGISRGVGLVTLKIFDITGREIATLVNEPLQPGSYEVTFDGSKLTSGVYFYKLISGEFTDTKRMILIK